MKKEVLNTVDPVDAVFVIGTGSRHGNEELRYALRNVEHNCPFVRDVYIVGVCPEWVDTSVVKHVNWPDRFTHAKDANIIDKLRKGCEQPGIAKKILFCSDDQFQTRVCTYEDFSPMYLRRYDKNDTWYADRKRIWHTRLRNTLERDRLRREAGGLNTADVFYYQPHIYMAIDRDKFIEFAKWSDYEHREDTIIASAYFNYADAHGIQNHDHIFIAANQEFPVKATHIAYHDSSFDAAMKWLKETFPNPSRFEKKVAIPAPVDDGFLHLVEKVRESIETTPAYRDITKNVEIAEAMRKENASGWKTIWTDIVSRWANATSSGTRRDVAIPMKMGLAATSILLQNEKLIASIPGAKEYVEEYGKKRNEEADRLAMEARAAEEAKKAKEAKEAKGAEPSKKEEPKKKGCSSCEARRRAAEEAARKKAEEEKKAAEGARKAIEARKAEEQKASIDQPTPSATQDIDSSYACLECARGHLASAIAYMNVNLGRPTMLETELAKGELNVMANHLLALKRNDEYNKCVEILDSVYSEKSLFTVSSLMRLMEKLMG